ncbi:MAG: DCC1-like thiol-disulfide oxidoreductase family protein [Patulibacter sp.]|nr:DCC1-like thiol-disulfide oxidoreductase family protein [Patulibacter sp.]
MSALKTGLAGAARVAALPIRRLARERPPAVADPGALHPGDQPPTDGRLLLLFDGGCGICLHARDVFAAMDRRHRLAFDRIARHDDGLLAAMDPQDRYGSWHVVHPDGRVEDASAGIAAAVSVLPGGRLPARAIRRFPALPEAGYQWFVRNRSWISQATGLIDHPERDPREQLHNPRHSEVV